MKLSKYNVSTTYKGEKVVFNTLTKSAIKENSRLFPLLQTLEMADEDTIEELRKNGFVTDDSTDERRLAHQIRWKRLCGDGVYTVVVSMTFDCNFRCTYCTQKHARGTNISREHLEAVIKNIRRTFTEQRFDVLALSLFGGEPLFNMEGTLYLISEAKRLGHELGFKVTLHVTTNGSIAPPRLLELLKDIDTTFQITIDGTRTTHNQTRLFANGRGSYDVIRQNIDTLYEALPLARIVIRVNYDNEILRNIGELAHEFRNYDKRRVSIHLHVIEKQPPLKIDADLMKAARSILNHFGFYQFPSVMDEPCSMTRPNSLYVSYDGKVHRCLNPQKGICFGEIGSDGTVAYTANPADVVKDNLPECCDECVLLPLCLGPCFHALYQIGKNYKCNKGLAAEKYVQQIIAQQIVRKYFEDKR